MKPRLVILHWMPVELFPPAMNMARFFAEQGWWEVSVCTNRNHLGRKEFSHPSVNLIRGTFPTGTNGLGRIVSYFSFHLKALVHLLKRRPEVILYIEPHSALPVYLSRLVSRKGSLFIHYHEYHSPDEFNQPGMRMARWCHLLEKALLYPAAKWISQTNEDRLRLFCEEHPEILTAKCAVLPNYPPASWWNGLNTAWQEARSDNDTVRMVYVGSLSRVFTYIEEMVTWIMNQPASRVTLDIYSFNTYAETRNYLKNLTDDRIRFHENGAEYDDLPALLRRFHVGLVLYRGNTPNCVFCASNKLFEYLACGLDVIYPVQIKGAQPYACSTSRPRVIECDFERMESFSYRLNGREALPPVEKILSCESALAGLEDSMLSAIAKGSGDPLKQEDHFR